MAEKLKNLRLPIVAKSKEVHLASVDSENLFAIWRQQGVVGAKSDKRLAIFSFNAVEYAVALNFAEAHDGRDRTAVVAGGIH